ALTSVQTMIRLAREAGVPVLIDPKGTDFERYRGATLLTPNLSEFEAVVGKCQDEAQIVERGMKLIAEFELSALLVTRSE
ncbi:bifunctional heptose 7-phosphate kinase/heptose 1-phosphate adenyltransferase, partial [Acinetobacter baumannii]